MDELGIDMHILSLTTPGVQMFDADTATELAQLFNDRLAEVVARHPGRYAGLAAVAPQSPKRAASEIERAITKLGLNGLLVNSHTYDEYYDQEKYYPIFEAAESLDAAIYLHPRAPMIGLDRPFDKYWMEAALWGYGVETSTHALRLIFCGLFDRFPRLKIVLGHMGEGLPFWLTRLDFMHDEAVVTGNAPKLQLTPSEYFKRNFVITTSGQENHLALKYSLDMLGDDNVMWAIDYPYQPMEPAVRFMETAPIGEAVRAKVFGATAARIFHVDQGPYKDAVTQADSGSMPS
jgi:2,3-dihydroxybenzoate decarboxylase/5-carboxyvanillate decarboxylase